MRNLHLDDRTVADIEGKVERVLGELGYSSGIVSLTEVRELLKLDLRYYTLSGPGLLDEIVHKLRVGAKQVLRRPQLLVEAAKKFELKALFIPDRKRILIDSGMPDLKKRWSETHEISHSLIPWHSEYMLGDNSTTLSPGCHDRIEAEANFGAGRLLFPKKVFSEASLSSDMNIGNIRGLSKIFGNTITSTLWRCVENSDGLMFALISEHPHYARDNEPEVAYFIRSKRFESEFSNVNEAQIYESLKQYCGYRKTGPLGEAEILLNDDQTDSHTFLFETFSTSYHALTLAKQISIKALQVSVA